ncbi:MAG: hypothetical protein SVY53_11935 [Chloroflexota bacterium]|nr:hypothetical protein [Chloroflexota bacterium]
MGGFELLKEIQGENRRQAEYEASMPGDEGYCPNCGYSLRRSPKGQWHCPMGDWIG